VRLEDITAGGTLIGLDPDGAADVMGVRWIGGNALDIAYRVNGATRSRLLTRSDEALLSVATAARQVAFDGDGAVFRLAAGVSRPAA
jgi:hypothetical protein